MELSKSEFEILNYIYSYAGGLIAFEVNNDLIAGKFSLSLSETKAITDEMLTEDLIEQWDQNKHFKITGKGIKTIHEYQQHVKNRKIWSIYVPIITAIIASEATYLINQYLSTLLK